MDDDLTREFLIESQEGLDRMERCLTDLEEKPQDAELIGEIFRAVHTIKGTTGFLGFKRLETLAHAGENLLGQLRDGKLIASHEIITGLLQLLDGLRSILKSIETKESEGDGDDAALISRMKELQIAAPAEAKQPVEVKVGAASASAAPAKPAPPAASASIPAVPALQAAAKPELSGEIDGIRSSGAKALVDSADVMRGLNPPSPSVSTIPAACKDQPSASVASQTAAAPESTVARPHLPTAAESTLRVDVAVLNRMMNLVGELVLTRNQVLQATAADPKMTMLSRRLDMVTADLRESVMKARMQPVSNIFGKIPRIVRDLSQSLGRRVHLQVEGQDTELDKSLLEAIKDPLTHAVRNSMDHGIEPPDVRQAAGKNPEGILKLRAAQEGSHVIVEVSDDGAGVDVKKVVKKALERGLITESRLAKLGEREQMQLIFLPGLSTSDVVTNVSGRGVGMDVVRTNVERIGGKVEIDSRFGKGTTLRMRIPLTLAIIPALIVRSVNQSFALPQGALSELVHVPAAQADKAIEWIEDAPLYRLRGKLLPLVFLDQLLTPGAEHKKVSERNNFIAVLDADGRRFGLVVDGLADPEEIVVKPLSGVLKDIGLYSGATVLGNADLALILDPGAIAMKAGVALREEEPARAAEGEASAEAIKNLEYLLVEVAGHQAAVALSDVLRIEQLPLKKIEYIGFRPVLNFEGQLLPVEDTGGVLTAAKENAEAQVIVVVCRESNRQVGIAVSQVLDVATGGDLFDAGTAQRTSGVTLLKNRVTGVVDLSGVAPLATGEQAPTEWSQMGETVA